MRASALLSLLYRGCMWHVCDVCHRMLCVILSMVSGYLGALSCRHIRGQMEITHERDSTRTPHSHR